MSTLLISPHNDDETLFCSFTILRELPTVVIVYDSYIQVARGNPFCAPGFRRRETKAALRELFQDYAPINDETVNFLGPFFLGLRDDAPYEPHEILGQITQVIHSRKFTHIYAPAYESNGHEQHNLVASAATLLSERLAIPVTRYLTYTRTNGKSRSAHEVSASDAQLIPAWIERKHRALACYSSQHIEPSTRPWFTGDLNEYYADDQPER